MGNPFSISSEFVIDDFSGTASAGGSTVDLALVARASSADFNTAPAYRLVYTLRNPTSGAGVLTILETGAGAGITAGAGSTQAGATAVNAVGFSPVTLDTSYTLILTGQFVGPTFTLTGTLTGGSSVPLTVTATDATPRDGSFFGYRTALFAAKSEFDSIGATTISAEIDYDNLIVVPEPAMAGLLGFGLLGLLGRRRPFQSLV